MIFNDNSGLVSFVFPLAGWVGAGNDYRSCGGHVVGGDGKGDCIYRMPNWHLLQVSCQNFVPHICPGSAVIIASVEMVVMVMVVMVVVWVFVMVVLFKSFTTTIRQKTYTDKKTNTPNQQSIQLLLGCLNSTTHTTTPIKPTNIPTNTTTPPPPSGRSYFREKSWGLISVQSLRDRIYRWGLHLHSFETNKWTVFLEIEAAFPYCDWSIKKSRIIWLALTSVHIGKVRENNWHMKGCPCFLSLCKSWKFLKTKTYSFVSIKMKYMSKKKNWEFFCISMVCIRICAKLSMICSPFDFFNKRVTPLAKFSIFFFF